MRYRIVVTRQVCYEQVVIVDADDLEDAMDIAIDSATESDWTVTYDEYDAHE